MANVSKLNINNTEYNIKDSVARANIPSLPVSTSNGGTGNSYGYIRTGQKVGTTIGTSATAEGADNTASGNYSHAEGGSVIASGIGSHAEGANTYASSTCSHAEGSYTTASNNSAHAEGSHTEASYHSAHAEGYGTLASGFCAHAEGYITEASGNYSHAGGSYTTASYNNQTVIGKYNDNKSTTLFEIGNGSSSAVGHNAFEVYENGDAVVSGDLSIKGNNVSIIPTNPTGGTVLKVGDAYRSTELPNKINLGDGNGAYISEYADSDMEIYADSTLKLYGNDYLKLIANNDGLVIDADNVSGTAVDTAPTSDSSKLVTSGGVATALAGKVDDTGDTISGTLILSKNTDASGTADNRPALIVGGQPSAAHIEIDGNEVIAKASATTTATLYLNSDGGGVAIGSGGGLSITRNTSGIYVTSGHTVSNTSYNDGPIVVFNNSSNSGTAAGIGFHNTGSNGVYLHLPRGSSGNHLVVRNHNSTATSTVAFTSDIPTVGTAAAKSYTDSTSASAIGTGTSLTTERDVYYGLPKINNSHTYNSNSSFYAPTSAGTSGYYLKSNGSGAPTWAAAPSGGGATTSYIYYDPNEGSPEARDSIKVFSILTHSSSSISTIPALITYVSGYGFTPMRYAVGTRIHGIGSGVGASIIELLGTNNSGNKIILKQDLTAGGSSMPFDDNAFDINNNGCGVINYFFLGSPEATLSDSVTNWGTGVYLHKFTINFRTFAAYQSNGGSNTSGSTYLIGGTVKWF